MISFDKKLSAILLKSGKVQKDVLEKLQGIATRERRSISELVIGEKLMKPNDLLGLISVHSNVPPIELDRVKVSEEVRDIIPEDVAQTQRVVPLDKIGDYLTLAVTNPFDILKLDDIRIITGCELRPFVALEESVEALITEIYKSDADAVDAIIEGFDDEGVELKEQEEEEEEMNLGEISDKASPVVKIVNKIIADAVSNKVSDIHIEPFEKAVIVRYRKDGSLYEALRPPKRLQNQLTSRLKIMSKLDIAEKRRPQDGKFQMKMGKKPIDFRVSVLPTVWGEKVVLRILDSSNLALKLDDLGFEPKAMEDYLWSIKQPYGMILVTGPTGSGKSTTLYSAIQYIHDPETNIVTVEDPVEYTIEGINQVPISVARGMTFAGALRSILRQDPDVILLGEIRDKETIEIAVKAALTGHLVLSTLHTNDAPSTVTRMIDMGLDPFMVASSTLVIAAQRLAKKLCDHCKEPIDVPIERLIELGSHESDIPKEGLNLFKAVGCNRCNNGYKGRFALLETMRMNDPIKRTIINGKSAIEIKDVAIEEGMISLRRAGLNNAIRGRTSIEEVIRCSMGD
ncbi:MAG: type II secretion system protein GspE [Planctomycetota bacterium]|nr:MAG: type II secretion system protein GspE [Planctomycetota bacterium]